MLISLKYFFLILTAEILNYHKPLTILPRAHSAINSLKHFGMSQQDCNIHDLREDRDAVKEFSEQSNSNQRR